MDAVIGERDRLHRRLARYGLPVLSGQANFPWFAAGPDTGTDRMVHALNTARIHIGHWAAEGIRLTVGRPEDEDAVLSVLAPAGKRPGPVSG
ncbi:hypothetical protein ACFYZJ_17870 [Streptomyces sp. NPDC001848]|uniref:hypothetical protein n=1 Tax=Streptomyces sp. NPDC001848 TaxID=3364618 RepID=UPI0036946C0A